MMTNGESHFREDVDGSHHNLVKASLALSKLLLLLVTSAILGSKRKPGNRW
jgi:hypothetical protein